MAVSFGEELTRSTAISNFMVVKGRSSYNAILGCPTFVAMKAVTSIYHLCRKFSTPCDVRVVRGNQYEAWMCYTMSVRSVPVDQKIKRTVGDAGLVEDETGLVEDETLTIGVPEAPYELDPDCRSNSN